MVQQTLESIGVHLLGAREVKQNARIQVAAARSHRNASRRREPHRSINGESIFYCYKARAVPQVRYHDAAR